MKRLLLFALTALLLAPSATAQNGAIVYERIQQFQFELPERMRGMGMELPTESLTPVVLLFTPEESMMIEAPPPEEAKPAGQMDRMAGMLARIKMGSGSRSDNESVLETYHNLLDDTFVQKRNFMGKTFNISSEAPVYAWKLDGEEGDYLGYSVHRATATIDSTSIEAWFALDIPVPIGPESYSGLPGAILVLTVNDGELTFKATEISLTEVEEGVIRLPEGGEEVSPEEYEQIVVDKMEEIARLKNSRGRRGRQ